MDALKSIKILNRNMKMFLVINFIECFSMGVFMTFAGIQLKEIGYGEHFVGYILSINTLTTAAGSVFSAYILERIGRKNSFILGFFCIAVGSIGITMVRMKFLVIIMSVLVGFGLSVRSTAEGMFITENTAPEERVSVFSLNFAIYNLGYVVATFLGGIISYVVAEYINPDISIQSVFIVSTALSFMALIPIYFMKEPENHVPRSLSGCIIAYKHILNTKVIKFMIFYCIVGVGAGLVVPFFSIYLKYSIGIGDAAVGSILSFSQFGCIIGSIAIPFLVSKLGRARTVIVCQLISIPFLLSIMFPQGMILLAVSFFMRNGLMNMATPVIQNLSMELVSEDERTNLSSVVSLASNISRAIGITIGGFLMESISYNAPYFFTVVLYVTGSLIFAKIYKDDLKNTKGKINFIKKYN